MSPAPAQPLPIPHWVAAWSRYLADFHAERPGVHEQVLQRCRAGDYTPYTWLARAVAGRAGVVLDIGCGSGAMARELEQPGRTVVGLDLSADELAAARGSGVDALAQADARRLPLADESVDVVVSTLGLAVIHPQKQWLDEVCRVLRPGGVFAALTPTIRPLDRRDLAMATGLLRELRAVPRFPVGIELASGPVLAESGLRRIEDNRERYRYAVRDHDDADLLLSALYLPEVAHDRVRSTAAWLARQAGRRGGVEVPVPMRRIVAMKPAASASEPERHAPGQQPSAGQE